MIPIPPHLKTFEAWRATQTDTPANGSCDMCGERPPSLGTPYCETCLHRMYGAEREEVAITTVAFKGLVRGLLLYGVEADTILLAVQGAIAKYAEEDAEEGAKHRERAAAARGFERGRLHARSCTELVRAGATA